MVSVYPLKHYYIVYDISAHKKDSQYVGVQCYNKRCSLTLLYCSDARTEVPRFAILENSLLVSGSAKFCQFQLEAFIAASCWNFANCTAWDALNSGTE